MAIAALCLYYCTINTHFTNGWAARRTCTSVQERKTLPSPPFIQSGRLCLSHKRPRDMLRCNWLRYPSSKVYATHKRKEVPLNKRTRQRRWHTSAAPSAVSEEVLDEHGKVLVPCGETRGRLATSRPRHLVTSWARCARTKEVPPERHGLFRACATE